MACPAYVADSLILLILHCILTYFDFDLWVGSCNDPLFVNSLLFFFVLLIVSSNLKQFGMCPLIWSLDEATHQKLLGGKIGNVPIGSIYSDKLMLQQDSSMQSSFKANQFKESGSDGYMAAVAFKPLVMREVLRLGFDLLWLDIDVALASDPRPWLAKHPQATVAISMNYPNPMVNSGVVYARTGGSGTLPLFNAWAEKAIRHECKAINCGDQEMFQQIMEDGCNMQQVSHIDQTVGIMSSRPHLAT